VSERVPGWCVILERAQSWGMPPWALGGLSGPRRKWFLRAQAWEQTKAKREKNRGK